MRSAIRLITEAEMAIFVSASGDGNLVRRLGGDAGSSLRRRPLAKKTQENCRGRWN